MRKELFGRQTLFRPDEDVDLSGDFFSTKFRQDFAGPKVRLVGQRRVCFEDNRMGILIMHDGLATRTAKELAALGFFHLSVQTDRLAEPPPLLRCRVVLPFDSTLLESDFIFDQDEVEVPARRFGGRTDYWRTKRGFPRSARELFAPGNPHALSLPTFSLDRG